MVYGYARVSTYGQARDGNSLDFQIQALRNAGAIQIFSDVFSGSKNYRPQLDHLLNIIHTGDTIIITKLDRIARSLVHCQRRFLFARKRRRILTQFRRSICADFHPVFQPVSVSLDIYYR